MVNDRKLSYATFFSGAGVGCQEFTNNGFECVVTNELIPKRLDVQKFNNKCKDNSQYILGNIEDEDVKKRIYEVIRKWKKRNGCPHIDVIICTPPCQGMSVANHHKIDELPRNSLIIQSIIIIKNEKPLFFIFENVRAFLTTKCQDIDGRLKPIREAIETNLKGYNIAFKVTNFKDFGNPSQRTRTLVIGVRKDLKSISPLELFPERQNEKTVREVIGKMRSLEYGQIDSSDIYHSARPYPKEMESWIENLKEGQSAFDNTEIQKIPHTVKKGKIVVNQNKNGDKYRRCYWDVPMPCIHTRNDIMASQMTLHPKDNRVFSIRELGKLMSIREDFKWCDIDLQQLNHIPLKEKQDFLKKEELNIRRSIGESVPPIIFDTIARNIRSVLNYVELTNSEISRIIKTNDLQIHSNLKKFLKSNISNFSYYTLSKISEMANPDRTKYASYYTTRHASFSLVDSLPSFEDKENITILEPSVGSGMFIPPLIRKYKNCQKIKLDIIDIDKNALEIAMVLLSSIAIPKNITIRFINADFLTFAHEQKYDIVIGNPPFGKITNNSELLQKYKTGKYNQKTNNLFSFFIEHSLNIGRYVSLIVPKTILSTPEFNPTRELIESFNVKKITDFGQQIFEVKIETIGVSFETTKRTKSNKTIVESFITGKTKTLPQSYIMSDVYPYWLIYRNGYFDDIAENMMFGIFTSYRDRRITKRITKKCGKIRVLKSRNIESNNIRNVPGYDSFIDKKQLETLDVKKYFNVITAILIPNLTYNPRACFMPKNTICDGSVAIAMPKNGIKINKKILEYYNTEEYKKFYKIARNKSSRSLNIDSNSIFFFGKIKQ